MPHSAVMGTTRCLTFISWFDAVPTAKFIIKVKNTKPMETFGAQPPFGTPLGTV
ncbi:hypothetical protein N9H29_00970 [Porticoccaceae bacterium]|nr:hypothetical protein [Porticoccaceae bacterium]